MEITPPLFILQLILLSKLFVSARSDGLKDFIMESQQHLDGVKNLALFFQTNRGYQLLGVDHPDYENQPPTITNGNGAGDGENKQADVFAYDPVLQRYVNGEVKLGPEIREDHSVTQFKLFSNLENSVNQIPSLLVIAIPTDFKEQLQSVLNQSGINNNNIEIVTY